MEAILVTDQAAGTAGMKLMEWTEPQRASLASLSGANYGDVVVQVHAGDELSWPSTWIDRLDRDRTFSPPYSQCQSSIFSTGAYRSRMCRGQARVKDRIPAAAVGQLCCEPSYCRFRTSLSGYR